MSETVDNPYVVLGIHMDATDDEVRRAYERRLADAAATGALRTAQRVDAAYGVLRDPRRRAMFDRHGRIVNVPRLAPDQRWATPQAVPFRAWTASDDGPHRQRHHRSRRAGELGRGVLAAAVVIGLLTGGWKFGLLHHDAGKVLTGDVWQSTAFSAEGPPVRYAWHRTRLLAPVRPPAATGRYTFEMPTAGGPVRWDPCSPIRYVTSGNEPFPEADGLLTSAISEVSADTGLQFVYAGTTTEAPSERRDAFQPTRYGEQWAPALIAWTDPSVVPRLDGAVAGIGGGESAKIDGQARVVSGIVALDGPQLAATAQRPNGQIEARAIILHELGHLVGLGHVHDPSQIMNPTAMPLAHYAAGDRRGLAVLGDGACPAAY